MKNDEAGRAGDILRHPALPYIAPFALFLVLVIVGKYLPFHLEWNYALRFGIVFVALLAASRGVLPRQISHPFGSMVLGVLVFVIWVAPDILWPAYRESWLFTNRIVGAPGASLPASAQGSAVFIIFRVLIAVVNVPLLEELFWRGWLMRWLINTNFRKVALGAYTANSFWTVAVLFASEHGSYWDVGLLAGVLYNWWMIRTRSLGDCMVAHAVTNACLAWYVLARGHWQYWM